MPGACLSTQSRGQPTPRLRAPPNSLPCWGSPHPFRAPPTRPSPAAPRLLDPLLFRGFSALRTRVSPAFPSSLGAQLDQTTLPRESPGLPQGWVDSWLCDPTAPRHRSPVPAACSSPPARLVRPPEGGRLQSPPAASGDACAALRADQGPG